MQNAPFWNLKIIGVFQALSKFQERNLLSHNQAFTSQLNRRIHIFFLSAPGRSGGEFSLDERGQSFPSSPFEEVETNLPVVPKVSTFFEFEVFGYFIAKNGSKRAKTRAFREYFAPIL